ncbi:hypothetical protein BFJ63_vAg8561 [Fusarium oxysporum f. sp. narcissi]|jgi:hypothetical protein|uniref:Uncharacterized protein n=3 Tax=Fusarium oxysporum TaxID=5507 RepID=A0A420T759_FUSOX|nr:hypothetical protein BFJ65_g4770 [Fusarium oxysporum f. sp. cepae]RKK87746.1 hypothetical protein BFJ69_g498 [Fusarium oxysporum]RYC88637.1 hypothetical protein BFJ63_vAg8561 [Fusarium oxysporum f. sp. narcissi]RKK59593.1 hypothetical protein BFJ66_g2213 [Fusarium oxysporum f. sp. cepae]RKK59658.1 hypothetical protein BFJ67_g2416 [Fusarium oxysporum f. sp. cepae]
MAQTSRGSQLDQAGLAGCLFPPPFELRLTVALRSGNRWARVVADGGGDLSAGGTGAGRGSTAGSTPLQAGD